MSGENDHYFVDALFLSLYAHAYCKLAFSRELNRERGREQ